MLLLTCFFSSILLSILGCLMVWNKYTYLTDSIIHILVLAAVLHSIFACPLEICSMLVSILFVFLSIFIQKHFADHNLVLNVTTTSLIAISLIVAESMQVDLQVERVLFGDILLTNSNEVLLLFALSIISVVLVKKNFNTIVITALNEDIASSIGINVLKWRLILLCFIALNVSMIIKIMGGIMVSSLSVVPVFFARVVSSAPGKMLGFCIFFSLICNFCGLQLAFVLNFAPAATICITQVIALFLTLIVKKYILTKINYFRGSE